MNSRIWQLLGVAAGALVIVIVAIAVSTSGGDDDTTTTATTSTTAAGGSTTGETPRERSLFAGLPQDNLTVGDPKAPATLVEYADLQCPFCAQYATQVLPTIVRDYVREGKLKLELRLIAILGPESQRAAEVAYGAADQDKLWEFSEAFFANQGQENSGYVTDEFLTNIGRMVPGLDVPAALTGNATELQRIQGEAGAAGIASTPTFLVGGKRLELTDLSPEGFKAALDPLLK